ncbi:MAG: hypothetical protein CBC13_00555 [Planctomycetia bacterium TMED53]|nr:MAG: hypothetical protein CBC13_00555 [Planctomycetia bacterium TMED53]
MKSITPWLLLIVLISPGWVHGQLFERPVVLQGVSAVSPGSTVENLTITIRGGRITEISESADVPLMSKKIDAKGLFATAGLVDHASVLTLPVGGAGEAGQWSWDGFDRFSKDAIEEVLASGVTRVHLVPVRDGGISGRSCWVSLKNSGNGAHGELVEEEAALCINLAANSPVNRIRSFDKIVEAFRGAQERRDSLDSYETDLEEYLEELKKWLEKKASGEEEEEGKGKSGGEKEKSDDSDDAPEKPQRPGLDANSDILLRALNHEIPVLITARKSADLINACELIQMYDLDAIIHGADEAELVIDHLKELEDVSFIIDQPARSLAADGPGVLSSAPRRSENLIKVLNENDLDWVIGSGGSGSGLWRMTRKLAEGSALVSAQSTDLRGLKSRRDWLRPGQRHIVLWSDNPATAAAARPVKVIIDGDVVWEESSAARGGRF